MTIPPPPRGGCRLMDDMTLWIEEIIQDPVAHEEWHLKYLDHFRSGGSLLDIALELNELGIARDHDVAYIAAIPQGTLDEISATIVSFLEREDRWIFRWDHEKSEEFSLRVEEDLEARTATFTLIGPHEGD
jgi:hypothetical protein